MYIASPLQWFLVRRGQNNYLTVACNAQKTDPLILLGCFKMFFFLFSSVSLFSYVSQLTWFRHRCANWQCQEKTNPSLHPAGAWSTSTNPNVLWLVNCSLEDIAIWFPSTHWGALQQETEPELLSVLCSWGGPWKKIAVCCVCSYHGRDKDTHLFVIIANRFNISSQQVINMLQMLNTALNTMLCLYRRVCKHL